MFQQIIPEALTWINPWYGNLDNVWLVAFGERQDRASAALSIFKKILVNFPFFRKLKIHLKGKTFNGPNQIKGNTNLQFDTLSKVELQWFFNQHKFHRNKYV